ncbi:protein of unknown function [Cnuella takakiae]|uniref:DUF4249 domain-containing protein n=1 Tax=Cnuella takakiae TaxID=1302690 RepID=A0A1M5H645_9BACT|nr:DUF4249 domain-containing protein [Cnuella takakiae]OLY91099.1 hypothetical protein BUE76_03670 [Cnuella takakiae]SHG11385.1 protein of unknown function [Cnuella takakiae]
MRYTNIAFYTFILAFALFAAGCVKPYEPPEVLNASSLLVVDGLVQAGGQTTIRLSRTRRLTGGDTAVKETGARLEIEGGGARYPLTETAAGTYTAAALPLQTGTGYRLLIRTAGGVDAASEFVTVKQTPPIERLYWEQEDGFASIYIDTRDPQNNTRYYRWDFEETWEYRAFFEAVFRRKEDSIVARTPDEMRYVCWRTDPAPNILLGVSTSLTQDVVQRKLITRIKTATPKMAERYSILVRQYALSREAFDYWQILQKNTEQRGSLFDAQPAQLRGNIQNLSNPDEPVVGFLSISSVAEQRIFIKRAEIVDGYKAESVCSVQIVPGDSAVYYLKRLQLEPAYFITGGGLAITRSSCVDCTEQGGVTSKPSFW